ncbi:hypothetical protein CkaCkLH20_07689 [Colletotrichum karsti]|uniref:Chromatin assembly factor 1 subunit A dimerization domain-containing protein n=1 Tax=Colletotrichum karsti TaxID=1095194 RepID=A0A9P6LJK6_9PEZI|nr:uncharacterized protein CkaCkLH20_07689 [Colletotrichum karsti]KAF9874995.1 hypothetical protein CkaCkLH20_07689 [Colletotrichum karsti]
MPEMEGHGLKRTHDEYSGDEVAIDDRGLDAGVKQQATDGVVQASKAMSPSIQITCGSSPLSSPASLTDPGTSTPARDSPSPNPTPTKNASPLKQTTNAAPTSNPSASAPTSSAAQTPAKRKRKTAAEKEAEEKEKAQKKKEREEKKAKADAEKEAEEKEKAQRKKEREEKKAKADAEKQAQKAEKAKADAEKQAALEKKERAQPKLMAFFSKAPATPKKEPAAVPVETESPAKAAAAPESTPVQQMKEEKSEYEKRFKPFFVHETVRMAKSPFEMDEETHAAKTTILQEYFDGKRTVAEQAKFDPVEIFHLPCRPAPRGRIYTPVKHTVEKMRKLTQNAEGAGEEDTKVIMKETTDALSKIPMKALRFWQDVRPPYKGTVTLKPYQAGKAGMRRLARKPTSRNLMPAVNYDHDSEAEWESEGEDVDIDDDDEEDLEGDGEDMDEFLDDSEDTGPARFVSANGLEPESSGLCWEDRKRMGPNRSTYKHRMEFILDLDHHSGIDPFSTKYWEPEPKSKAAKTANQTAPTSAPANAFQALGTKNSTPSLPKKMLENNHLQELKKVIQANPKIAKGGLIDLSYVALAHAKVSRNDIKEAIATVAERAGGQGKNGTWVIKPLYLD